MPLRTEFRDTQPPEVTIPGLGKVKGVLDEEHAVVKFLNIPFGVVNERWRPASEAEPWTGVRDATKNGSSPPQATTTNPQFSALFESSDAVYEEVMSERDSLCLNIYIPVSALVSDETLPVCVWIHGGGFKFGSITSPLYDCTQLVSTSIEQNRPMIMVSINYRLNFFGFMSSKELVLDAQTYASSVPKHLSRWYDGSVGNWGILDQILGLEWVRDHIQAFRGDPGRVTVMGESAGSISISCLMLIPECRGLFHRAIMQSGAAASHPAMRPEHEGQRYFDYLCQALDVPHDLPGTEKVARLRAVPEKTLAEVLDYPDVLFFSPSLDGVLFKKDTRLATQDPLLYDPNLDWVFMGTCADEGTIFTAQFKATNAHNIAKLKARLCAPGDGPVFDQLFGDPKNDEDASEMGAQILGNRLFRYPVFQASEAILAHPTCRLTRYHVDVRVAKMDAMFPSRKSYHTIDLLYTFGNKTASALLSEEEMSFSKVMQGVWIDVITSQSPEASTLPKVTRIQPAQPSGEETIRHEAVVFGADLKVGRGAVERMSIEEVGFWKRSTAYMVDQAELGRGAEVGLDIFKAL
ncbi:unnamed protein product [Mortierella alpina]